MRKRRRHPETAELGYARSDGGCMAIRMPAEGRGSVDAFEIVREPSPMER
jgi:hypothetical protein